MYVLENLRGQDGKKIKYKISNEADMRFSEELVRCLKSDCENKFIRNHHIYMNHSYLINLSKKKKKKRNHSYLIYEL